MFPVGTGRRPPAPPERVPEGPVWRNKAVRRFQRPGEQRAPPTPPPPSHSGPRADGGRPKKRRPRTPPEEAAASGVRGHHGRGRRPHALPADGRRRTGGAQDGANGAVLTEGGPGKMGARTRAGGFPPPPPPPPAALAPDARGRPATPTARAYPGGARRRQRMAGRRPTGRGGGGAAPPPPPPPAPPPLLGSHRSGPLPPRSRGDAPPPKKGPRRGGGGMRREPHTARPRSPSRLLPRGSRPQGEPTPSLGAVHGGAPEQYGGRALHDPPVTTAHSGRAEGGFSSAGAPLGRGPRAAPHPPSPRGGTATLTARARRKGVRRQHEGGQDWVPQAGTQKGSREAAAQSPPPAPPPARKPRGPRPPPPRGRGDDPPPRPREEQERDPTPRPSRRLPQGPRRTSEPAPTRQDAAQIASREGGRARTGVVSGATRPMDSTTPVTPALLPAQGRQRDGTRQSDPPPYRPPPGRTNGGYGARPPPPPPCPPPGTRTPRTRPAARSPHRACRPRGQRRAPTPAGPRPQHVDSGPQQPAQWAGSQGRGSAWPQTPLATVEGTPPGDALPPPPQPLAK